MFEQVASFSATASDSFTTLPLEEGILVAVQNSNQIRFQKMLPNTENSEAVPPSILSSEIPSMITSENQIYLAYVIDQSVKIG